MDTSAIILGFTGRIGSGCSTIAQTIAKLDTSYKFYKLSDIIRDQLNQEGNTSPSISDLQDKGNALRSKNGNGALVRLLLDRIQSENPPVNKIIIDGFKNPGEISVLRHFKNYYLFSIHADDDTRRRRCEDQGVKDFISVDKKDKEEDFDFGQKVKSCNYHSDIIIDNNAFFPKAHIDKIDTFVKTKFLDNYIKLIEAAALDSNVVDRLPNSDELCMTMAYALSKMCSCIKRKVGALIVETATSLNPHDESSTKICTIPTIISTGYNEVPLGCSKCVCDPDYQKCYRDHLQCQHAREIKCCPNCGNKLPEKFSCQFCNTDIIGFHKTCPSCKREDPINYICTGKDCNQMIFSKFLPGGKTSPGKLLDLCRALHAEEMTLIKLSKTNQSRSDLTLFTTTQPCNLCANKIVAAGIKNVVYTEPYSMKEASEILKNGGVKVRQFEGVKSSAYFKFYR